MENVKINQLIRDIKNKHENDDSNVYIDELCDYNDSTYICDAIAEMSDNHVDIYYSELFDWAKDNYSYIEEANQEMGTPNDITKQIQQAQFYVNENYCYENIKDMLLIYCYDQFQKAGIEEISEDLVDKIEEYAESIDSNDYLPNIDDINDATAPDEA